MIESYYAIVEEAILAFGISPEQARGEQPGQWNLKKGKFDIFIDVWEQESHFLFQVVAPLCSLPDENREAYISRVMNFYSHSSLSSEQIAEPTDPEKQIVKFLFNHLINESKYWKQV